MLTFCVVLIFGLSEPRAQSNTEYNFRQQSVTDGVAYNGNGDPVPVLSMDCLAANGYGLWTLSSTPGQGSSTTTTGAAEFPAGWYLLGNGLYAPSTHYDGTTSHPGCIPPGVVQCAPMPVSSEAEVYANLDGSVDYVWPDRTPGLGTPFVVSQFTSSDVDLSLSFLSNPQPVSAPGIGNMNVVTSPIHSAVPEIATNATCGSCINCPHDVVITTPHQDEFQVASDARYLYIVWCSQMNICNAPTEECWATVVDRTTLTTVTGWPQDLGNGEKPTVSCDPRNNRVTPSPAFEVEWLRVAPSPAIMRNTCTAGSLGTAYSLAFTYINPSGVTKSYNSVSHARVLVSSAPGATSTVAVYAIVNDETGHNALIFYRPANSQTAPASYVDGILAPPNTSIDGTAPGPVIDNFITAFANPYDYNDRHDGGTLPDQFHCVYQIGTVWLLYPVHPLLIVEGGDNGLIESGQNGIFTTSDTRLILNQAIGGACNCDHILFSDPASYVAAVNQMGIHIHWEGELSDYLPGVGHFYARDMNRTFDEDIEENTLVTDSCIVSDGRSHGGTLGATIQPYVRMAVYSDPNYGPPSLDGTSGLFSPRLLGQHNEPVGQLSFLGDNVKLFVGNGQNCGSDIYYPCPSTLTVMPFFYFNFPGRGQGVTVAVNSTFDYYGLYATHNANGVQTGIGTPFTDGTGDYGGGIIDLEGVIFDNIPAFLNVHGGADFYTGWGGKLISNIGQINVNYEASAYPVPTSTSFGNAAATGHMTLVGQTLLQGGGITGNIPYAANDPAFARRVILTVPFGFRSPEGESQFSATDDVNIANSDASGTSELDFGISDVNAPSFSPIIFDACQFSAIELHAFNPVLTTTGFDESALSIVDGCTFDNIRNKCIFIENDNDPLNTSNGPITIDGNYFNSFAPDVADPTVSENIPGTPRGPFGIYLKNFDDNANPSFNIGDYTVPVISNNFFTYNNAWNSTLNSNSASDWTKLHHTNGAIGLENSTAMITGNTITDRGYSVGISIFNSQFDNNIPKTYSVLCGNKINGILDDENESSFDGYAIMASGLHGIICKNTITGNDIGIELYDDNQPGVVYDTITGNREIGLECNAGSEPSVADMSSTAIGQTPGALPGAFNKISGESVETVENEQVYPISIIANQSNSNIMGNIQIDNGYNSFTVDPANASGSFGNFVIISYPVGANIGHVENNFWGTGVAPTTNGGTDWGSGISVYNIITWQVGNGPCSQSQTNIPSGVSCPSNAPVAKTKKRPGPQPQSLGDSATCAALYAKIYTWNNHYQWQEVYDSGRHFIETCYGNGIEDVSLVFSDLNGATIQLSINDTSIFTKYHQWLESVLYLDTTDPGYFCSCVNQIAESFPAHNDTTETLTWEAENRALAVLQWLVNNGLCDTADLKGEILSARGSQYEDWLNDTLVPLDTTLLPLDSIEPGLLELLEKHFLYADVPFNFHGILSNATANPNPAAEGTVISFSIAKEAYVKIELFNVLGNEVSSAGFESLFEPGNKSVPLSLAGLPSGTYFARILTAYGEVQSLKLVKE